ncbi:hypothetical protein [Sphingosinithalassobacter sp. LHW66-3]|uniref:hypothetical protein n=1 Tax=Sphingosinithalassobacter sp. LHW66-3 TaxID=3424718 RepID=UPI003D6B868E
MSMVAKICVWCVVAAAGIGGIDTARARIAPLQGMQDASQARATVRQERGQNLPAREIERRIVPRMRGAQYLGFDYDPETNIYTLKFLRDGSVIWVDVDGRSGRVVRQTGN